jgi:hypothetical protein
MLANVLAIVGIVVAVLGAAVAVYYGRRALNPPKRLILWQQDATPLLSLGHDQYHGVIDIRVLGRPVENPYIGRLTVENIGRQDIDSGSFDQGRPIRFEVHGARKEATFLDSGGNPPGLHVRGNEILIGPELLRSRSKWTVAFVADGKPRIALADSYLVNAEIRERRIESEAAVAGRASNEVKAAVISASAATLAGLVAGLASIFIH